MEQDDVISDVNKEDQIMDEELSNDEKVPDVSESSASDDSDTSVEERDGISLEERRGSVDSIGSETKELKTDKVEERNLVTPPPPDLVDEGAEADTEPDIPTTSKKSVEKTKAKKKPSPKRKKKKKSPNKKKGSQTMNGTDVFLGGKRKRLRGQPNKRKKIRKLLTENELQQDTLKALQEEEDRQKRLLERDNASKLENSAGISFKLLDTDNFSSLPYDLSFIDDLDVTPIAQPPILNDVTNETLKLEKSPTLQSSSATFNNQSSVLVTSQSHSKVSETLLTTKTDSTIDVTSPPSSVDIMTKAADPINSITKSATFPQFSASAGFPSAPIVQKVAPFKHPQHKEVICISSESSDDERVKKQQSAKPKTIDTICISSGSESSEDIIFNGTDDNEIADEEPDVNNSGMHVDDALNYPDEEGRILVNKNRPPNEPEIYLSPRLSQAVKPHQVGGIRFMFDNIVESLEQFKKSNGFGCILAHSMGLGKTLQVISFVDVFLRYTGAKTALCVVPVNTLLNWVGEFEMWLPQGSSLLGSKKSESSRSFNVRLLSDMYKTTESRAQVIASWKSEGGVLLMGYEMFRLLTNQKSRRRKKKKKNAPLGGIIETIDLEEEDRTAELVAGIYEHLVNPGPDLIVCDEGHRIKNSHASISQALKQIATRRRIVLTGYPLQNNLLEYWCMVDFVRPNFLGTRQEFSNMFERPICNGQCADSNEQDIRLMRFRSHVLHSLLKGFVQRRSHLVLKNSLPPKEEYVLQVRMSDFQKRLYNTFIKLQKEHGSGSMCSSLNPIKAFSICCKIWNHPDVLYRAVLRKSLQEQQNGDGLLDMDLDLPEAVMEAILKKAKRKREAREKGEPVPGSNGKLIQGVGYSPFGEEKDKGMNYDWAMEILEDYSPNKLEVSGKMVILMKIIEDSISKGDKILVFSQSLTTLTIIEEFLSQFDVPEPQNSCSQQRKWVRNESYFRLDGNTSSAERERLIQQFNDKENNKIHLFLLSTRAGCLGINLVGANRVVVFDISWNPCHDAQAVCRVYRYGQTKKCVIYRLICDQTMEKKIYDRQISKQGMADRVVDELNPVQSLERQDITKLLIYDDAELPAPSWDEMEKNCNDETLTETLKIHGGWLTRAPFHHESLLMDCKGSRLTKAEKRAAQKGYEIEKRASSSFNYSRPSYANFYAAAGYPEKGAGNGMPGRSFSSNRPVANVRPIQSSPYPMQDASLRPTGPEAQIIAVLKKSGINVQKTIAVRDVPLPHSLPGSHSKPLITKGEPFYLIHGIQSLYIGTTSGRIFAIRSKESNNGTAPRVQGLGGQLLTPRERESQIIKTAFNAMIRRTNMLRQPIRSFPNQSMSPSQNFQLPSFMHNRPQIPPNSQDIFGSSLNHPSIYSNSSSYYPTMQNPNQIVMNQSGELNGNSFGDLDAIPVVAEETSPPGAPPHFHTSRSAPELSSLLNFGGFPFRGGHPNFGSPSMLPSNHNSDSNWLNFLREGELVRNSGIVDDSTQSGNTFPQDQTFSSDHFSRDQTIPAVASAPASLVVTKSDPSQDEVIMQHSDIIGSNMTTQSVPPLSNQ